MRWRPKQRATFVNEVAGGVHHAADLLDVAPSQPSRWANGEASPSMEQATMLIDFDHVMSHALLVFATDELVRDWLSTPNAHLDDARPVDSIRLHGTSEAVDTLRSEAAGTYT